MKGQQSGMLPALYSLDGMFNQESSVVYIE